MWQFIPQIGTPLAALAFVVGAVVSYLKHREALRYKALDGVTDPNHRLEMLRAIIGRDPSTVGVNATDKVRFLEQQYRDRQTRFKWLAVGGFVCFLAILAAIVIVSVRPDPRAQHSQETDDQPRQPITPQSVVVDPGKLPLARMDNFGGNALVHRGGTEYSTGRSYRIMNPRPADPVNVYPAVAFELAKVARHDAIRVVGVRVRAEPVEREIAFLTEHLHVNITPPITYVARMSRKKSVVEPVLKINGQLADGLVRFTEDDPVAKFRVEFEGEPGLYFVGVEVDVQEARGGRRETLRSDAPACVHVSDPKKESAPGS